MTCYAAIYRSRLSPGPFNFLTPRRRGGGGRWTSLHESISVCPPLLIPSHLIPAPCTDFTTYIFCTITLLFALSKHTHTNTRTLSCTIHPHKHKHIIFFALSTPAAQEHFPPGHRHCHNHCTLYHRVRPFPVSGNTLCEYVLPMCMYM